MRMLAVKAAGTAAARTRRRRAEPTGGRGSDGQLDGEVSVFTVEARSAIWMTRQSLAD